MMGFQNMTMGSDALKDERSKMLADIISAAPENIKAALMRIKMENSFMTNFGALEGVTCEVMADTLAYLLDTNINDDRIKRLLKKGRQLMILRTLINLMPTQCTVCTKNYHYMVGEPVAVQCTRCTRPACGECFPQRHLHWHHLCDRCTTKVEEQEGVPADYLTAVERKKEPTAAVAAASQPAQATQPSQGTQAALNATVELEDNEEEDRLEEERRRKRENEAGGREELERRGRS